MSLQPILLLRCLRPRRSPQILLHFPSPNAGRVLALSRPISRRKFREDVFSVAAQFQDVPLSDRHAAWPKRRWRTLHPPGCTFIDDRLRRRPPTSKKGWNDSLRNPRRVRLFGETRGSGGSLSIIDQGYRIKLREGRSVTRQQLGHPGRHRSAGESRILAQKPALAANSLCWRPEQVYSARVGGPNRKFRRRYAGKIGTRRRSTLPRLNPNPRQLHLLVSAFRLIRSWQEQSCLPN